MNALHAHLLQRLDARDRQALTRKKQITQSPTGPSITVNGKRYLCFSSNDYLGLANHPDVKAAAMRSIQARGVSGGASHVICGHHEAHQTLEDTFAKALGRDKALFFTNGYMANLAVLTSLLDKKDAVFQDKWNHASLIDAGIQSGARFQRYLHNNPDDLVRRLQKTDTRHRLICSDSVFSMDGDICNIDALIPIAREFDALLYLDDAHGLGVLGETGLGIVEQANLSQSELPLVMVTLGKALGAYGAIVAGEAVLIDTLEQFARTHIYTTSLSPAMAEAALTAFHLLTEEPWRREHLHHLIRHFKAEAARHQLPLLPSDTGIQPLMIGSAKAALAFQDALKTRGILVNAIRPPTVPAGTSRLRVTLSAAHTFQDVDRLLDALIDIHPQIQTGFPL